MRNYCPIRITCIIVTVQVIPGPRSTGYVAPSQPASNIRHKNGIGTGKVEINILNDLTVQEESEYDITFADSLTYEGNLVASKNYSLLRLKPVTEE